MTSSKRPHRRRMHNARRRAAARERGVAIILAMMFLVIFGSLAAAMAIVSQGNLRTSETQSKINRSLAAAESGLDMAMFRAAQITRGFGEVDDDDYFPGIFTTVGLISNESAYQFWFVGDEDAGTPAMVEAIEDSFIDEGYDVARINERTITGVGDVFDIKVGPISLGGRQPSFTITYKIHPFEDLTEYDKPLYAQPPYDGSMPQTGIDWAVDSTTPLDGRFVRVIVQGYDDGQGGSDADGMRRGPDHAQIRRTIQMDFMLDKKIPFALLSRSRIMIGRNVIIDGPVGSRFNEPQVDNGHPITVLSDFRSLEPELDDKLDGFKGWLITHDRNNDNRIDLSSTEINEPTPLGDIETLRELDHDGDGFLTDFDYFLAQYDANDDGKVSKSEFGVTNDNDTRGQLFSLLNQHSPLYEFNNAAGNTGNEFLDAEDFYAKIRGSVSILSSKEDWENGAASGGSYKDYMEGTIVPDYGKQAFNTGSAGDLYEFEPSDFNVVPMLDEDDIDSGSLAARSIYQLQGLTPGVAGTGSSSVDGLTATYTPAPVPASINDAAYASQLEAVPYGARYPYEYYARPVFENMHFTNAVIPKGTNALFINCTFKGTTFVEIETENSDETYNYIGMQNVDGTFKHPDKKVTIDGVELGGDYDIDGYENSLGTKRVGNNLRFHDCTIVGRIISGELDGSSSTSLQPLTYTHVRNKIAFTGSTQFTLDDPDSPLTSDEKKMYQRSMLMLPHVSVEIGYFGDADVSDQGRIELSGVIVAGLIDIRGDADIRGTVLTTFGPRSYDDDGNLSPVAPVIGATSAQFNTTLGYFGKDAGDLEAELPTTGSMGRVRLKYDESIPLPDGINGPLTFRSIPSTYAEGVR